MPSKEIPDDILSISNISNEFHQAGALSKEVIIEIFNKTRSYENITSVETGCGKSTLLFSRISSKHLCFTLGGDFGQGDGSLTAVQESPFFEKSKVEFILGPTQRTLPGFPFKEKFQVVFIDGPHGFPFPNLEYYFFYPHLEEGGLLIVDDIHIPTIGHLADFIKEDDMFELVGNVDATAFFRRTSAPLFDPFGDGWWLQKYNAKRFPELASKYFPKSLKSKINILIARLFGATTANAIKDFYRKVFR